MKKSFHRRGLSLLPVLAVGFLLASMMLYLVTQQKSSPTPEQRARGKLSALSAINKAALDLRQGVSLPPEQTIASDGVEVKVSTQTSADGNTIQIVAKAGDEVTTARAVRVADPAVAESSSPATPSPDPKLVPNPAVAQYLRGFYMTTLDAATGEWRVPISAGKYIVMVKQGNTFVAAETQPCFPPVPATAGEVSASAPSASAPPAAAAPASKWVVYNADNVIISADSTTRASAPETPANSPANSPAPSAEASKLAPAPARLLSVP